MRRAICRPSPAHVASAFWARFIPLDVAKKLAAAFPNKKSGRGRFFVAGESAYAENDEPQPQVVVAFGFLITNCAPSRPSW